MENDPADLFIEIEQPPPKRPKWVWIVLVTGIAIAACVLYFVFSRSEPTPVQARIPAPPGWNELEACDTMRSIDGTREAELYDDHRVVLWDFSPLKEGEPETRKPGETTWSYDADAKRYSILIGGRTELYSLITLGEPGICILLKGDRDAANLNESWFATRIADDDYEDVPYQSPPVRGD
jgi:hypothetical protein